MEAKQRLTVLEIAPGTPTSAAVLEAVADQKGERKLDLPPLYESADPDALDRVFKPAEMGMERVGLVSFPYSGLEVAIRYDGRRTITLTEAGAPGRYGDRKA